MQSTDNDQSEACRLAETCLRCFISHQTVQVCTNLAARYGRGYGISLAELLPWVLDNQGLDKTWRSHCSAKPGLASQILSKYNPTYGSLTNWTIRLVLQDHHLNLFLVECGLYLISDWAILNNTQLEQLQDILSKRYLLTPLEVEQASILLKTYHNVYREARGKGKAKGKCLDPNEAQLRRMGDLLHQPLQHRLEPIEILEKLHNLANQLRHYQVHARGGTLTTEPIHQPEIQVKAETQAAGETDEAEQLQMQFLQAFQQEGIQSLDLALDQVIRHRIQKSRNVQQGDRFLLALKLLYCERQPMKQIAPQVGLSKQASVTNLLRLNDLRADVRRHMLKHLLSYVQKEAQNYTDPQTLDARLITTLDNLLENLMQEDARQTRTPKNYARKSLFAERLYLYLSQR
ncbi:MAG: hypothetical protein NW220_09725 [Leptolyngbyaceae cyanobacterium bins.349]|nr:hypothetical protein [Leptolyngbyaceae cyanobacterium bins.349]